MQRSNRPDPKADRRAFSFGAELEKRLSAYAAAAAAAGVSLLALAPPGEAKIVYTPAHISITVNGKPVPLDLNHDGVTDFLFSNVFWVGSSGSLFQGVRAGANNPGNRMWGRGIFGKGWGSHNRTCSSGFAAVLPGGFNVRPNDSYLQKSGCWVMAWQEEFYVHGPYSLTFGQWLYTQNRYLGLKFVIGGQIHFGWARFSVTLLQGNRGRILQATLTGYAYETIPNKPIITGKTKGPDVITLEPASLGRLAQGASGISAWREKK
jgi:hypothetical protein